MSFHRLGACIFGVTIGIGAVVHAYQLGLGDLHKPGPGFIFFCAALFLAVMGCVDLGGILTSVNKYCGK